MTDFLRFVLPICFCVLALAASAALGAAWDWATKPRLAEQKAAAAEIDELYPVCPLCPCHMAQVCRERTWAQFPRPLAAPPCPCQPGAGPPG